MTKGRVYYGLVCGTCEKIIINGVRDHLNCYVIFIVYSSTPVYSSTLYPQVICSKIYCGCVKLRIIPYAKYNMIFV
jgi:hypothetical protein